MGTLGGQPAWATWTQALGFWLLFPLSLFAWWRERRQRGPHWLWAVLILNSFAVVALFVGHWRYRVTLDVAVVLLLALFVDRWLRVRRGVVTATDASVTSRSADGSA